MKKHGCFWWLCISWWWLPIKWMFYSIPVFIIRQVKKSLSSRKPTQKPSPQIQHNTPKSAEPPAVQAQSAEPIAPANIKTYRATGMGYRIESLLSLGVENEDYHKTKKELIDDDLTDQRIYEYDFYPHKTELVPEPDNPHDPNAIKVVVDGVHIAYIKAGSCSHLLKVIGEGRIRKITCDIAGGKYKYVSCDYDDYGEEEYTVERDETPYSVVLHVTEE